MPGVGEILLCTSFFACAKNPLQIIGLELLHIVYILHRGKRRETSRVRECGKKETENHSKDNYRYIYIYIYIIYINIYLSF